VKESFEVRVPASTSNLGSGFDVVSAALSLYLTVRVTPGASAGLTWDPPLDIPRADNILEAALFETLRYLGQPDPPALRLSMDNPIPLQRGLGSSGAAIVAGIKIAETVTERSLTTREILDLAYPLEGHPENLAASLLGGWIICRTKGTLMEAEKIGTRPRWRYIVAIPDVTVSTKEAREILPTSYSLQDTIFNLQRVALLVHAVHSDRGDLLKDATEDRIHQPYRAALVPGLPELLQRQELDGELEDDLLSVSISGSGSAVLAIAAGHYDEIGQWMLSVLSTAGTTAQYLVLNLDNEGACVRPIRE